LLLAQTKSRFEGSIGRYRFLWAWYYQQTIWLICSDLAERDRVPSTAVVGQGANRTRSDTCSSRLDHTLVIVYKKCYLFFTPGPQINSCVQEVLLSTCSSRLDPKLIIVCDE
jgi:hypothetical protein